MYPTPFALRRWLKELGRQSRRVRAGKDVRYRRLLTIEVHNGRRAIVQVRGRCNKTLGSHRRSERMRTAGEMLRRWARESRLSIACGL